MTAPKEIRNLCWNPLLKTSGLTVKTGCTLTYSQQLQNMGFNYFDYSTQPE